VAPSSPQSSTQSPQQPPALPRQVAVDSGGVGTGGAAPGGARSRGARSRGAGTGGVRSGGAGAGGVGAGGADTGAARFGVSRVGVPGTKGARTGGAGAGDPKPSGHSASLPPRHALPGGLPACTQGAGAVGAGAAGVAAAGHAGAAARAAAAAAAATAVARAGAAAAAAAAAAIAPAPAGAAVAAAAAATVAAAAPSRAAVVPALFVLPSPPPSSLPVSPTPISEYYRVVCPVVSCVLATVITNPRFSPLSVSALTAAVAEFAVASRLDYNTRVVPALPTRPLSVEGEFALGCDVLEDRHSELEYLAAASPSLCTMLLSPEGDPDAFDIPTPCTYREAVSGPWASQWKVAMDSKLASWRSTGTYVDAVPPPRANIVDGMWLFKVKQPLGSPPVFKARYVARGFSQCEGVDFFQTFAPTSKMNTLQGLLHVAAQRDYELHSLNLSATFLQGRLHEEIWFYSHSRLECA
ncbi:unnamed protein product, partial [Closterium sp. NIES-54]